jgi:hypothetical protein
MVVMGPPIKDGPGDTLSVKLRSQDPEPCLEASGGNSRTGKSYRLAFHSRAIASRDAIAEAKRQLIHDHVDHCLDVATNGKGRQTRAVVAEFKAISRYL